MTSIQRKMQRARLGVTAFNESRGDRPQAVRVRDTNYLALHPTKGWRRFSNRRIAAQLIMANMLGA
jgi:hypothetical protein